MAPVVYTEERVKEIVRQFQDLLMEADNFPRDRKENDFRKFWTGLRGEGANLLGLTNHLISVIENKEKKK